jgi:purine-binding chemotaxis protein CheW
LAQLAVFRIGGQEYAIDIMRIQEIIPPLPITKVPKAPRFVEGVVELRGAILPVVDLRKRLDAPAEPGRQQKIIIVELGGRSLGLVVDGVREVLRLPQKEVRPPPELGLTGPAQTFFSGLCRSGSRIIMVIDLDRLLSSEEKVALGATPEVAQ